VGTIRNRNGNREIAWVLLLIVFEQYRILEIDLTSERLLDCYFPRAKFHFVTIQIEQSMEVKEKQTLGLTELTVEDLKESESLEDFESLQVKKSFNSLSVLKAEERQAQHANYGELTGPTISILKKKPPSSPGVSVQTTDKRVNFSKETASTAAPIFKSENEQRIHKDCPCCTCHLKDSSLKALLLLQSIPERTETKENEMELSSLQYRSRVCVSNSAGFVPLARRSENSPSQLFRNRFNQRLMKQASKIDSFQVPDSLLPSPYL